MGGGEAAVLRNAAGAEVEVIARGAAVTRWVVPGRAGEPAADVALGLGSGADPAGRDAAYAEANPAYLGVVVGRVANRISGAAFPLGGRQVKVAANVGGSTCLHGGPGGFHRAVWQMERLERGKEHAEAAAVRLTHVSPDGDQGFPGRLTCQVTYRLARETNRLWVDFKAYVEGSASPVNLAQHTYFNLGGHASGDVRDHVATLYADAYTPLDADLIPTGEVQPVAGTALDFRAGRAFGERLAEVGGDPKGYDFNYVPYPEGHEDFIRAPGLQSDGMRLVADVHHPASGRAMMLFTDAPGVQLYTGNFLGGSFEGKEGCRYGQYAGFCLETQGFPDAVNVPAFPSVILEPGDVYAHHMAYDMYVK